MIKYRLTPKRGSATKLNQLCTSFFFAVILIGVPTVSWSQVPDGLNGAGHASDQILVLQYELSLSGRAPVHRWHLSLNPDTPELGSEPAVSARFPLFSTNPREFTLFSNAADQDTMLFWDGVVLLTLAGLAIVTIAN